MTDKPDRSYPELLTEIAEIIAESLADRGVEAKDAALMANEAAEKIRFRLGGLEYYIPKCQSMQLEIRDVEIMKRFDGQNHADICREYGISERRLRQILKCMYESGCKR
jgi:Mor family transcriptional regulator